MKLHLEQKPALEGAVEVASKVSGGNEDAVELLHLFQDDVLDGVFHPFHRVVHIGETASKQSVSLVEKQNRRHHRGFYRRLILAEDGFDVFLALANPFVAYPGHVDLKDAAPCGARQLHHGLGLASARRTIEETCETGTHAVVFQTFTYFKIVILHQQRLKSLELRLLGVVVKHGLRHDVGWLNKAFDAFVLLLLLDIHA